MNTPTPHATQVTIECPADPPGYYQQHANELAATGAAAFGQPLCSFASQVAERFKRAKLAQVLHVDGRLAGFALYNILRGHHWQSALY